MEIIGKPILDILSMRARECDRKRMNHNYHSTLSDSLQRMLNAVEPNSYVQPHKHENPDKVEAFIVLRGKLLVAEFDETGKIISSCILSQETGNLGVEIPARTYHTIISLEPNTVVYEVKNGPYLVLDDKNFAPWAPKEGSPECAGYLDKIRKECVN